MTSSYKPTGLTFACWTQVGGDSSLRHDRRSAIHISPAFLTTTFYEDFGMDSRESLVLSEQH
jgi:hypothetical protein